MLNKNDKAKVQHYMDQVDEYLTELEETENEMNAYIKEIEEHSGKVYDYQQYIESTMQEINSYMEKVQNGINEVKSLLTRFEMVKSTVANNLMPKLINLLDELSEKIETNKSYDINERYKQFDFIKFLIEFKLKNQWENCTTDEERDDIYALYTRARLSNVYPSDHFTNTEK